MCRSAAPRSEAQFGSVQVQFTRGAGSGSGSVQTTRDQDHSSPAQPRHGGEDWKTGGRGRGEGGRRSGAQGCKEVERGLLLDAVISRRGQGPG